MWATSPDLTALALQSSTRPGVQQAGGGHGEWETRLMGWTGGEKCPRRLREGRWWAGALSQRLKPSTTSSVTSGPGVCVFCKLSSVGLRVAKARARMSCSAGVGFGSPMERQMDR